MTRVLQYCQCCLFLLDLVHENSFKQRLQQNSHVSRLRLDGIEMCLYWACTNQYSRTFVTMYNNNDCFCIIVSGIDVNKTQSNGYNIYLLVASGFSTQQCFATE